MPPATQSPAPPRSPVAEERLTRVFPLVRRYVAGLLDAYLPGQAHLREPLGRLVAEGRASPHELSLPLLVHASMTGDPAPAVPVAAVHALWWRAANAFDDLADDHGRPRLYGMPGGVVLTAALECGYALPLRALAAMEAPGPVREDLTRTYLDGWTTASNGQLGDLLTRPDSSGPRDVLAVYRDKSGAIYAMACAMAARLAIGTGHPSRGAAERIAGWRRFGQTLGLLAQFRNDEDDLHGGPGEDLRNQTPTYLLVHLLSTLTGRRRERALALLRQAPVSQASRAELRSMMTEPTVLRAYHARLAGLRDEAYELLGTLAPDCPFGTALGSRVHAETHFLPPGPDDRRP
ncbi:hypothetical protein FM076_02340 [Streptomyces albus subsp. chlorinus]|uniref:polyprenyl synthetase family protein n=1 Tax=Streptomyces albus TaxID=1888 RepID=UPI001570CE0C|nr:polyprenyl synthetase family protein [Streptomyces albus]NSC20108.1 hypothetical protein [Streptomyces albus subsp. chlorinus]